MLIVAPRLVLIAGQILSDATASVKKNLPQTTGDRAVIDEQKDGGVEI
jgi:hypothetical protein